MEPQIAHTPGPWHLWPEGGRAPDGAYVVFAKEGWSICRVQALAYPIKNGDKRQEDEPNARLIAAAPELLVVANLLVNWRHGEDVNLADLAEYAEEAIAKARGL